MGSAWRWVSGGAAVCVAVIAGVTVDGYGSVVLPGAALLTLGLVLGPIQGPGDRWMWALAALAWSATAGVEAARDHLPVAAGAMLLALTLMGRGLDLVESAHGRNPTEHPAAQAAAAGPMLAESTEDEW